MKTFIITRIVEEKMEVTAKDKATALMFAQDQYSVLILKETCVEDRQTKNNDK